MLGERLRFISEYLLNLIIIKISEIGSCSEKNKQKVNTFL